MGSRLDGCGLLILPDGTRVPCCSSLVDVGDGYDLCLSTPQSLCPDLPAITRALLEIAEAVYACRPFELALIGEEAGAVGPRAAELQASHLELGGILLSPQLRARVSGGPPGQLRKSGLYWFPCYDGAHATPGWMVNGLRAEFGSDFAT